MKDLRSLYLNSSFIKRLSHSPAKSDLFRKAIGKWPQQSPILDLCGGWGRDALCFASWGFKVTSLERSREVYDAVINALKQVALETSLFKKLVSQIDYRHIDAKDFLQDTREKWPLIYLDPMYSERNKSALGKGEMRILKDIVGEDPDKNELAHMAYKSSLKRLVIKSPRLSPSLLEIRKATHVFKGSSTRYEIFVK